MQGPPCRHRSPALRFAHVVHAVHREALQVAASLRRGRRLARGKVVGCKGCRESVMRTTQHNAPALTAHSGSIPRQAGWPRSLPSPNHVPMEFLARPSLLHAPLKASIQRGQMFWICTASYAGSTAHPSAAHQHPELFITISYGTGFPVHLL